MDYREPGGTNQHFLFAPQKRGHDNHGSKCCLARRRFLAGSIAFCASSLISVEAFSFPGFFEKKDITGRVFKKDAPKKTWKWSVPARYSISIDDKLICSLCPHTCELAPGDRGFCRSRVNIGGRLYSLSYGNPCAMHVDPIEKKPLFHFMPKTKAFSIAAAGCTFRCLNCQNWEISQAKPEQLDHANLFPVDVVRRARQYSCTSIAYTYSEPVSFFEYMYDTAKEARQRNIYNLLISNGYINKSPLSDLCNVIDAANINLKSFDDEIYMKLNGGRLGPVLNTLRLLHEKGVHLEITTLVVPGYVDDMDMIKAMCRWIVETLGPDHPHHFLRFFPKYKLDRLPPTPVPVLEKCRRIAQEQGIRYVYIGNVPGHPATNTYCHECGKMVVKRKGYYVDIFGIKNSRCIYCDTIIPGRWPD